MIRATASAIGPRKRTITKEAAPKARGKAATDGETADRLLPDCAASGRPKLAIAVSTADPNWSKLSPDAAKLLRAFGAPRL